MEQKKSKKILIAIIVVVVLLVLIIGGFAIAYFATDIFKSNKELFLKYASSLTDEKAGLIDSTLKQYYEKLQTIAYENNGTLKFNVNLPNAQEITKRTNDFNISFAGKVDSSNKKVQQDITLDYGNDVQFPFHYRQVKDMTGLQTEYVGSNYIVVKNKNLLKSGIANNNEIETIPFLNDGSTPAFTAEEMKQLQEKYINTIIQELRENNFSKLKTSLGEGYQLTLDGTQIKNILNKMLETLKGDTVLLEKINKNSQNSETIGTNEISEVQQSINNNTHLDSEKLEIILYQQNKTVNKIVAQINEGKIEIEKIKGGNELQYLLTIQNTDATMQVYLSAKYTGIQSDNVSESFELGISYPYDEESGNETKELTLEQEKELVEKLIADVKSTKLLQGQDTTTVTDKEIENTLNSKNDENYKNMKLEKLSETLFKITFISNTHSYEFDNTGKITKEPEKGEEVNDKNDDQQEENTSMQYKYNLENNVKITGNVEIEDFTEDNSLVLDDLDTETATNLMNAIGERVSQVNKDQMSKLGISEAQNPILYVAPFTSILAGSAGNVSNMNQQELEAFNSKFDMYASSNTKGATVKGLLTVIQTNNQENNKKIQEINFDGQEYEVTEQNITLIKSSITVEDDYKVEFEYDRDTGAIYRAIINKK